MQSTSANDEQVKSRNPKLITMLKPKERTKNSMQLIAKIKPAVWAAVITAVSKLVVYG